MKNGIRILGIEMSLILASSCCVVSQGAELEKEMDVGKYMTVRTEQKTQRMEIQKEKFTEMKQEAEHKGVSDLQLSKQILQGIGLQSDGLIAQQLANLMEKSKSITCGVQYLQINEAGDARSISQTECMEKIVQEKQAESVQKEGFTSFQETSQQAIPQLKANGDITSGDFTSSNQYMEMALIVVDQSSNANPGKYMLIGIAHWLKTPTTRKTDAITISATNFTWSSITNQNLDNYASYFQYNEKIYVFGSQQTITQTKEFEKTAKEAHMDIFKGFYFNWDLPKVYPSIQQSVTHSDFAFMIMGIGNFYDYDMNRPFNVQLMYTHLQTHLTGDITFSWGTPTNIDGDIGLPGAVVSGNWTTSAKYYGMPLQVWHKP